VNWLERVIKTIDGVRVDTSIETPSAHFSPGDACAKQIINCLLTARDSIDICVFTISDNQITDAILSAHEKGKGVRIISDNDKANDRGSDIYYLAEKGVPVRLDQSPYHMHHKFAIFDQKLLINGSFNWTRSASLKNEENITILHEPSLIDSFVLSFEELWLESKDV
jgi:phosphatidylserine/phosphatidylglycerophosphate/cardiolipin synthase-like enzyme